MDSALKSKIFTICLMHLFSSGSGAQTGLNIYSDMGRTNASQGVFIKSVAMGQFATGKNCLIAGFQIDQNNRKSFNLSGLSVIGAHDITIKKIRLELRGFYTRTYYSEILGETDFGAYIISKNNHFEMKIGNSFRTFSFRKKSFTDYEIETGNSKFHENFNLIYTFSYYLKPIDNKWNAGLSITDMDNFSISQETNPVFNIIGYYKVTPSMTLNAEVWYLTSGLLNNETDYFGYFFRTGLILNFK